METPEKTNAFGPAASTETLQRRSAILKRIRRFFARRGFLEVETPILSSDTVVDRFIDPVQTQLAGEARWLQTSPEFCMKRLVTSGIGPIFQVTKSFRDHEFGDLHNPEFTIVEWYDTRVGYEEGMDFLEELAEEFLHGKQPSRRTTYHQAFLHHAGCDPFDISVKQLQGLAETKGIVIPDSMRIADRDEWLNLFLATLVEPKLGIDGPEILYDYPASQSALAIVDSNQPMVARRFELYYQGVELANGYHELLDPAELRRRNDANNALRRKVGNQALPTESKLLIAMEHGMPDCVGVALGLDRLVMLALKKKSIREVMAFPYDLA